MYSVMRFSLASVAKIYTSMILYDFTKVYTYGILRATCKSRVGVRLGK